MTVNCDSIAKRQGDGNWCKKRGRSLKYGAERSEVRATNTAVHEGMHACTVWQTL